MTTIVTRVGKGSTLTWAEMDANLTNLNNDKLEVGSPASSIAITPVGELTSTNVQDALSELDSEVTNKVVQTSTTGAAVIPTGSTAQRPTVPAEGHFRRNSELGQWEGYDGSQWNDVGGVSLTATQTLTNKTLTTPNIETSFNYTGSSGIIQVNGNNRVTIGSQGIETGSLAPGSVTPTELSQKLTAYTAVAASGTAIDFTGIPSWVKRITVMFNGVSLSATSDILIQLGDSGGIENTGYLGVSADGPTLTATSYTTGFAIRIGSAAGTVIGSVVITHLTSNTWIASGTLARGTGAVFITSAGSKTLSDVLTQVRITTANGTDTFDAGTINIMWE